MQISRRSLLKSSAMGVAAIAADRCQRAHGFQNPNDRPTVAVVGCGSRWDQRATLANGPHGLGKEFPKYSDIGGFRLNQINFGHKATFDTRNLFQADPSWCLAPCSRWMNLVDSNPRFGGIVGNLLPAYKGHESGASSIKLVDG